MGKQNKYFNKDTRLSPVHQKCNRYIKMHDGNETVETVDEDRKIISLYKNNIMPSHSCYFATDSSAGRYCEHNLDRRSRLYNFIMDEPCPTCQLPTLSCFDNVEKPIVKSRYMDFYYKQLEEKKIQSTFDDPTNSNDSPKANQNSSSGDDFPAKDNDKPSAKHNAVVERTQFETTKPRYLDFLKKIPQCDETDKCKKGDKLPAKDKDEPSSKYNGIVERSQFETTKPRYLDFLKKLPQGDEIDKCKKVAIEIPEMDWKEYHRLITIHNFLDDLQYNFPSLCTTGVIGSSLENRDLKVLKVSNSKCGNASVWIDAGIHAREWIAPAVNTYLANYIVKNFKKLPKCMTNKDWYFLPVMNPDGYEYSHTNYRMWRKNKAYIDKECVGVDLNRNFSYGWGGKGSSDDPKSPFYHGPRPFSEPESRAVRDMLNGTGINFQVYVTMHSYGEVILFPYAYRDELCPDYIRLLEGATVMSKAIHKITGTTYKVGISRDVMYGAAGTSCDWAYGGAQIPFCYLLELRSKKHKFRLPEIEIEETGKEIVGCIMALMEFVDNYDAENCKSPNNTTDMVEINPSYFEYPLSGFIKVAPPLSQVWAVRFTDDGQKCFVRSLDTCGAINIWKEERSTMDFFVDVPRVAQVAAMLHERGIPFSVSIRDVEDLKRREQGSTVTVNVSETDSLNEPCTQSPCECMNWNTYHSLRTIYGFMDKLAAAYPYLCHTYSIGKTCEGRDIKILKISNGNPDNPGVWLDGDIHAREWVSVAVVTYIANEIVQNFHKQPAGITDKDWYILPVMNPDGYVYTHTNDRMWRKNRAQYGPCVGVDLNRNFSYGWGEAGEDGSSEDPGSIFYRGPKPFSEPETAAVKKVILESETEFKVFLSFHSYGEVIIFPWGYTGDPCPSYVELLEGGTVMARAIHEVNGRTYKVGSTKDIMYYASGTSIDWSYGVANIPYSYMIELPSKKHRFLMPKEDIISTAAEVFNGLVELMAFVDKRSKATSSTRTSVASKL